MELIHYYNDYLRKCANALEELGGQLHELYKVRNDLYNVCIKNINLLNANGITYEMIQGCFEGIRGKRGGFLRTIECGDKTKGEIVRRCYNKYVNICNRRIPFIISNMRYYDWMARIPYYCYVPIQRAFNRMLAQYLLRGDNVSLGTYIGLFEVLRFRGGKYNYDLKASYARRNMLIEESKKAGNLTNVTTKSWLIKSLNVWYWAVKYRRFKQDVGVIPSQIFYKFKMRTGHQTVDVTKAKGYKNIEDVIVADNVSFDDKLDFIVAHDPFINERFKHATKYKERTKTDEVDEYIRPKQTRK